ncbi:MAG: hypothetical protein KUA43_00715 [Hoeflea sp.]|uniref:hypothetical protein n=1 Tax=Hoeflea sp. TaxID=1940281 RepID=UPI001DB1DF9A|nr:hypothetical protein [Hoeflea sp.]MBU4530357.1 hypothetical protein [Alphaproteobacteria bacterium]MBU4545144.1 hypothetical protein [Alphaproteobacteria bacterium]MBU4549656.1 hypothetical protein [Alphaproteobacteria bacterium]MBV1721947.1 hypothetical protein [Hoeflea sp.]MBV1761297.1 hypothetical protein [Hoeflea sp.]
MEKNREFRFFLSRDFDPTQRYRAVETENAFAAHCLQDGVIDKWLALPDRLVGNLRQSWLGTHIAAAICTYPIGRWA